MKKVYCKKCAYFRGDECWHPENIIEYSKWDEIKVAFKTSPKILNMNNDCKWFEEK